MQQALAAMNPAMQAGLVAAGAYPFARPAAGGQMQPSFFFPGVQQMPAPRQRTARPPARAAAVGANGKKQCNCKNSRCLKL